MDVSNETGQLSTGVDKIEVRQQHTRGSSYPVNLQKKVPVEKSNREGTKVLKHPGIRPYYRWMAENQAKTVSNSSEKVKKQSDKSKKVGVSIFTWWKTRKEAKKAEKKEILSENYANKLEETYKKLSLSKTINQGSLKKVNRDLIKLATLDPEKAGRILEKSVTGNMDAIVKSLAKTIPTPEMHANIIIGAAAQGINIAKDKGALLRSNEVSSKLLNAYTTKHISPAFKQSSGLQQILNKIPDIPKEIFTKEVPVKDDEGNPVEDEKGNKVFQKKFGDGSKEVLTTIVNDLCHEVSQVLTDNQNKIEFQQFQRICHSVSVMGDAKFGSQSGSIAASNFLILRAFNPLISSPESEGVPKVKLKEGQRNIATQATKVLQRLANNIDPAKWGIDKETHFGELRDYAEGEGRNSMQDLRNKIIGPTAGLSHEALKFQNEWTPEAVLKNRPLFKAMNQFAEKRAMGTVIHFIRDVHDAKEQDNLEVFKEKVGFIDSVYLRDESSQRVKIADEHKNLVNELLALVKKPNFDADMMANSKVILDSLIDGVCSHNDTWQSNFVNAFKRSVEASTIERLAPEQAATVLSQLAPETANELLKELKPNFQDEVIKFLAEENYLMVTSFLGKLDYGEAVTILSRLPLKTQEHIKNSLDIRKDDATDAATVLSRVVFNNVDKATTLFSDLHREDPNKAVAILSHLVSDRFELFTQLGKKEPEIAATILLKLTESKKTAAPRLLEILVQQNPEKAADVLFRLAQSDATTAKERLIHLAKFADDKTINVISILVRGNPQLVADCLSQLAKNKEENKSAFIFQKLPLDMKLAVMVKLTDTELKKRTFRENFEKNKVSYQSHLAKLAKTDAKSAASLLTDNDLNGSVDLKGIMDKINDPKTEAALIKEISTLESATVNDQKGFNNSIGAKMLGLFLERYVKPKINFSELLAPLQYGILNDTQVKILEERFVSAFSSDRSEEMNVCRELMRHVGQGNHHDLAINFAPEKLFGDILTHKDLNDFQKHNALALYKSVRINKDLLNRALFAEPTPLDAFATAKSVYYSIPLFESLNAFAEDTQRGALTHFLKSAYDTLDFIDPEVNPKPFYNALKHIWDTYLKEGGIEHIGVNPSNENLEKLKNIMKNPQEQQNSKTMKEAKESLAILVNRNFHEEFWPDLWLQYQNKRAA